MKNIFTAVAIFISQWAAGQSVNQCGFIVPPARLQTNFNSVYEAGTYVNQMLDSINWQENFNIREQNGINNAYATIIRNQRYIVYDNNNSKNKHGRYNKLSIYVRHTKFRCRFIGHFI